MKKIPTLFVRDFDPPSNGRYVTEEVTPGCEWVLAGEGMPTRKFDGSCFMFDGDRWWARREVKPGHAFPSTFIVVEEDAHTGKVVGWEWAERSGFWKYLEEAIAGEVLKPGTYELCGPKVNGNPEHFDVHVVVAHGDQRFNYLVTPTYDYLKAAMTDPSFTYEGTVWHHPDGRMAKLKKKDFVAPHTEPGPGES